MAFDGMGLDDVPEDTAALQSLCSSLRRERKRRLRVVEIGSWAGRSALAMAPHALWLICVDHWLGNAHDCLGPIAKEIGADRAHETFLRNTRGHPQVIPLRGESSQIAKFVGGEVDLVYIDASHDYEDVISDIDNWLPRVTAGGVLCGHDYAVYFPGVIRAVNERFGGTMTVGKSIWVHRVV